MAKKPSGNKPATKVEAQAEPKKGVKNPKKQGKVRPVSVASIKRSMFKTDNAFIAALRELSGDDESKAAAVEKKIERYVAHKTTKLAAKAADSAQRRKVWMEAQARADKMLKAAADAAEAAKAKQSKTVDEARQEFVQQATAPSVAERLSAEA